MRMRKSLEESERGQTRPESYTAIKLQNKAIIYKGKRKRAGTEFDSNLLSEGERQNPLSARPAR